MTAQTPTQRVQATRLRKKRGLVAVTVASENNLSLDVTPDQLDKIKAWSEQNSEK